MNSAWKYARWAVLITAFGGLSCTNDVETFCASRVQQICTVLADCCTGSTEFDAEGCELTLSTSCQNQLRVEEVHAGDFFFDEGAANTCLGTVTSCDSVTNPPDPSLDVVKACGNMLTGHRPPGAACSESAQCEKAGGDYPVCHGGSVCAKAIISEDECSFSFETLELKVCAPGKYCKVPDDKPDPDTPPTKEALEFSGTCKSPLGKGGKCLPDGMELVPCDDGLYCEFDFMVPEDSVCKTRKGKGEVCAGDDCKEGLQCDFDGMETTCQEVDTQGLFCFKPPKCGNGECEIDFEDETNCPADCNTCGNGFCDEDPATCPADCGGGAVCGDGTCDFNGTEPATCPEDCCGDGFCDPGETNAICPLDCP